MFVLIDFEGGSSCDLKKAGAWRYAQDPTTQLFCLGYSIDGEEPIVLPEEELYYSPIHPLAQLVADPAVMFIAHNVGFEKAIWREKMVKEYGWPNIPNSRWHDSQASCAEKALPLSLDRAGLVLRLAQQKASFRITDGSKFDRKGNSKATPEFLEKTYAYNAQDVRAELDLNYRVGILQPRERKVWLLDQRINERGVRIDLDFVRACQHVIDGASRPMLAEFRDITGIEKLGSPKLLGWCQSHGVKLPNLQKGTITALLGASDLEDEDDGDGEDGDVGDEHDGEYNVRDVPTKVRRALEIRRTLGSASVKKLGRLLQCVCSDGRVRGVVQYHGAGPGRWAGRLFQPQNFPRESHQGLDPADVIKTIMSGDHRLVEAVLGDPVEAIIRSLRHCIVASDGRMLNAGDLKTIEARIVLAMAGQADKVAMLARGESPYIPMAQTIYGRPIDKHKDVQEYTIGKATVLGCGFNMGWETFKKRYCPKETDEFAQRVIQAYRREFAPEVPKLWRGLEEASVRAVWDHCTTEYNGIEFKHEDIWLTMRLHSGRKLYYAYPRPVKKEMKWSTPEEPDVRMAWTCQAQKGGRWITRDMYGGLETENAVQGEARDILVHGMFLCEENNFPVVLTVHDENITEPLQQHSNHVLLGQLMAEREPWAKELNIPVEAETWEGRVYRK